MDVLTKSAVDGVVRAIFSTEGHESVDELLCHPDEAAAFAVKVAHEAALDVTIPEVLRRLIALRKRGQERGGLSRTKREFRGRIVKPR